MEKQRAKKKGIIPVLSGEFLSAPAQQSKGLIQNECFQGLR